LKCTKFNFGGGSSQTPLGELTEPAGPLAGFGERIRGKKKRRRKVKEGEREKKKGKRGREEVGGLASHTYWGVRGYCSLHIKQGNARAQPIDGLFPRL